MTSNTIYSQLLSHLTSKHLPPTKKWLTTFLSTTNPSVPIAALKQTAVFRLLAADLTTSVQPSISSTLPTDIHDATNASRVLKGHIPVQVLDVEDLGRSRWSQIEAIEAFERGETTKGREVIRVVPGEEGLSDTNANPTGGPFKVLLQDSAGNQVYGFEASSVEGINAAMSIGTKILLSNVDVARGLLLLQPTNATVLGGKVDALHTAWKTQRKERLKAAIEDTAAI